MRSAQPWRTNRARALRSKHVSAEDVLWRRLRNRQLGGFKFVRQLSIGPYFADFACRERKLIVEVDGGTHSQQVERKGDARRALALRSLGYRIVRVDNADVYASADSVLDMILAALEAQHLETSQLKRFRPSMTR